MSSRNRYGEAEWILKSIEPSEWLCIECRRYTHPLHLHAAAQLLTRLPLSAQHKLATKISSKAFMLSFVIRCTSMRLLAAPASAGSPGRNFKKLPLRLASSRARAAGYRFRLASGRLHFLINNCKAATSKPSMHHEAPRSCVIV